MVEVAAALGDREWHAHRHVEGSDAFRLVQLPRAARVAVPFMTDEYLGQDLPAIDVPTDACLRLPAGGGLHFLFHSAFCGSTMLVHALDKPGQCLGLSEPVLFNDIVGFRRRRAEPARVIRALDAALRLAARGTSAGEAVVVKPSNVLNPLGSVVLSRWPQARALFLYAPLPVFLVSVARKGLQCRLWVRELLEGYLVDGVVDLGFTPQGIFRLTDLQVAAVGWLVQHRLFHQFASGPGGARLASLDSELLMADPAATLAAVWRHYGLPDAPGDGAAAAFSRHSKTGADYSPAARKADYAAAGAAHADEIDKVAIWARVVADNVGLAMAGPRPLLG